ncbi:MAG TPA: hypothetical protein VHA10_18565 [Hypericibacter adhaerens]|jgi:hypothetical protein|uniref:OmpA-like domain-containing protein n=1 Tax=Hypericibacter adhaerens TaxID=2602016 RepID=A0A5J6MTD8_9PROT|nr:hypothetical protein [Hypericibacter adhaerens]QEX20619.1 hypothetical protein FRZ61_05370 [Hypericibacter adhaerens]HWA45230.1 hypothetical protein [Hypericibacter adhaerens]
MSMKPFCAAIAGALLILSGCTVSNQPAASSQTAQGSTPASPSSSTQTASATPATTTPTTSNANLQQLGSGSFKPEGVTPGQPTGTVVGKKVEELRGDLTRLQTSVTDENSQLQQLRQQAIANANNYHNTVGAIEAKLQVGTTKGNPILVAAWNQAQAQLEQVNTDLGRMNSLANEVASNAGLASYLLEATRAAFGLSGAVDEDHEQLTVLEDETNKTTVLVDRLLTELTEDVARQTNYLAAERSNLNTLALAVNNGELYGQSFATRSYAPAMSQALPPGAGIATGRPLVVIRFDRDNPDYEQALFAAVSATLDRRPNAAFDLVGVAPSAGSPAQVSLNTSAARRAADKVMRSLTSMGLSADRVSLSTMTSPTAQTNEVHLYVR